MYPRRNAHRGIITLKPRIHASIVQVFTLGLGLEGSPVRLTVVMLLYLWTLRSVSIAPPYLARFELSFVGVVEILALALPLRLGPKSPGGRGRGAGALAHDLSHGAPLAHGHASAQGDSQTLMGQDSWTLRLFGVWRYFTGIYPAKILA